MLLSNLTASQKSRWWKLFLKKKVHLPFTPFVSPPAPSLSESEASPFCWAASFHCRVWYYPFPQTFGNESPLCTSQRTRAQASPRSSVISAAAPGKPEASRNWAGEFFLVMLGTWGCEEGGGGGRGLALRRPVRKPRRKAGRVCRPRQGEVCPSSPRRRLKRRPRWQPEVGQDAEATTAVSTRNGRWKTKEAVQSTPPRTEEMMSTETSIILCRGWLGWVRTRAP